MVACSLRQTEHVPVKLRQARHVGAAHGNVMQLAFVCVHSAPSSVPAGVSDVGPLTSFDQNVAAADMSRDVQTRRVIGASHQQRGARPHGTSPGGSEVITEQKLELT